MVMYEDEHLEAAYEDLYTTQGDWDAEDESDHGDDEDEPVRPPHYVGQHRA